MEHWNKGGLSREEFLHMREDAMRKLQELAKRQTSHPRMPAAASSPPNSTRPHLQKPEAASSPPVLKEPLTKLESKPLLDAVPAKNGGEDRPAYTQPLPSGLSAAEKTGDDPTVLELALFHPAEEISGQFLLSNYHLFLAGIEIGRAHV